MFEDSQLPLEFANQYDLQETLGKGASGLVMAAIQKALRRRVAIKFLEPTSGRHYEEMVRFKQEALLLSKLDHPMIPTVYDFGVVRGHPYIVSQLIEGESLARRLERIGSLPFDDALRLGIDLCQAIEYIHRRGIWHRDVKPANLIFDENDRLFLLDFGLALQDGARTRCTQTGTVVGTLTFMDPDLFIEGSYNAGTDLYALATTLYVEVTGQIPYGGDSLDAHLSLKLAGPPVRPSSRGGMIPMDLDDLLCRALDPTPEKRIGTATEFRRALKRIRDGRNRDTPPFSTPRPTELLESVQVPGPQARKGTHPLPEDPPSDIATTPEASPNSVQMEPGTSEPPGDLASATQPHRSKLLSRNALRVAWLLAVCTCFVYLCLPHQSEPALSSEQGKAQALEDMAHALTNFDPQVKLSDEVQDLHDFQVLNRNTTREDRQQRLRDRRATLIRTYNSHLLPARLTDFMRTNPIDHPVGTADLELYFNLQSLTDLDVFFRDRGLEGLPLPFPPEVTPLCWRERLQPQLELAYEFTIVSQHPADAGNAPRGSQVWQRTEPGWTVEKFRSPGLFVDRAGFQDVNQDVNQEGFLAGVAPTRRVYTRYIHPNPLPFESTGALTAIEFGLDCREFDEDEAFLIGVAGDGEPWRDVALIGRPWADTGVSYLRVDPNLIPRGRVRLRVTFHTVRGDEDGESSHLRWVTVRWLGCPPQ